MFFRRMSWTVKYDVYPTDTIVVDNLDDKTIF
jgi:hypothetical protein